MSGQGSLDRGRVRNNFHRRAGEYERHAVVQRRAVRALLGTLAAFHPPAGPVLEIGCGTGLLSRELARRPGAGSLVLSDLAHGMTRAASARLPAALAVDADALDLPFGDGRFALVASASVYQWVEPHAAAFAEAGRVLAPGGLLAVALFGGRTLFELREAHRAAVSEADGSRASHALEFASARQVRRDLAGSGLEILAFAVSEDVPQYPDVPALLRSLKGLGAGNAARQRPGGLASRRVMERMIASYRERHGGPDGIPATYEVIRFVARRR